MRKPCTMCVAALLIAVSGSVQAAQWARLGGGSGNVFYIDKGSVINSGKTRKAWSMHSFAKAQRTPEGKPYRSVKALHQYSCDERTTVLLSQVFYPEAMGKGEPVENYKYEKFSAEDIVPDSPFDRAWSALCKR